MTILFGGGHTYHLSLVGHAIQQKKDEEALRLLTSGYLVPLTENGRGTLQRIILKCPNLKLIEAVIEKLPVGKINAIDSTGVNAVMTAAKCRNIAAINLLVAAKADVNLPDALQQTPLHQVMNKSHPLDHDPSTTVLETVQCLLMHRASMEIRDKFRHTALQAYVYTSDYDPKVISLLVSKGAEPPYADVQVRPPNHALKLNAAIQTGLELRRTAVCEALTSHFSASALLALINEYV